MLPNLLSAAVVIGALRVSIICLNLPESRQLESADWQHEGKEFLSSVFESKMNLNTETGHVNKLIR